MKFVIFAAPYDERSGGSIVMQYLCHLINELGGDASLFPRFENHLVNALDFERGLQNLFLERAQFKNIYSKRVLYQTNPKWNTPLFSGNVSELNSDSYVVVYAEWTFGNPLNAKNVARWILHNPGYHRGHSFFSKGEVQFRIHEAFDFLQAPWLEAADFNLFITSSPIDIYACDIPISDPRRTLITYCIRKGKYKPLIHHPKSAVCIDGLGHEQIADLFKRSKLFISYDSHTRFSKLALLSGCASAIVPDEDKSGNPIEKPKIIFNTGIGWGIDDAFNSFPNKDKTIQGLRSEEVESKTSVFKFLDFWRHRLGIRAGALHPASRTSPIGLKAPQVKN